MRIKGPLKSVGFSLLFSSNVNIPKLQLLRISTFRMFGKRKTVIRQDISISFINKKLYFEKVLFFCKHFKFSILHVSCSCAACMFLNSFTNPRETARNYSKKILNLAGNEFFNFNLMNLMAFGFCSRGFAAAAPTSHCLSSVAPPTAAAGFPQNFAE